MCEHKYSDSDMIDIVAASQVYPFDKTKSLVLATLHSIYHAPMSLLCTCPLRDRYHKRANSRNNRARIKHHSNHNSKVPTSQNLCTMISLLFTYPCQYYVHLRRMTPGRTLLCHGFHCLSPSSSTDISDLDRKSVV